MRRNRNYSIGEVVATLKVRYPNLRESKLRFLEDEGLISPKRTLSGYRQYSDEDLALIERILKMQKDSFFPLSVIKERIENPDAFNDVVREEISFAERVAQGDKEFELLENMHNEYGITDSFIREMEKFGLIRVRASKFGERISANDLVVVLDAWRIKEYGIEPKHLRMYVMFCSKEADFFEQILIPTYHHRTDDSAKKLDDTLKSLTELTNKIHVNLRDKELYKRLKNLL